MLRLPVDYEWARISGNYCPPSLLVLALLPLYLCLLLETDGSCFIYNDFVKRKILKKVYFFMYITNKMHKLLVIRLYFPLDTLHVSDYISPFSGAIFYKLYIAFCIHKYVWLLCGYSHSITQKENIRF